MLPRSGESMLALLWLSDGDVWLLLAETSLESATNGDCRPLVGEYGGLYELARSGQYPRKHSALW